MAIEENTEEEGNTVDPSELLPKVEKQAKAAKFIMLSSVFLCVIITVTVGVGMFILSSRLAALEKETMEREEDAMDIQFAALEERLLQIAEFRKSEQKTIKRYTKELAKLSSDCSADKAAPFLQYLSQREMDFQKFIQLIKSGTTDLAGMTKGSRKWLSPHNKTLDEINKLSKQRQTEVDNLL